MVETNAPATFSVYHEEVLPALVAANTPPTFNVVRVEILPAMNRAVASMPVTFAEVYGDIVYHEEVVPVADADPFSEHVVGGLGPQLPYDPMRGVDYGFVQALLQQNADPFAEQIVGGLGPQSDLDPMMTVMTDWIQPASNVDSFSEQIVGGLGPQGDIDPFAEEIVGGLGPQINFVASN